MNAPLPSQISQSLFEKINQMDTKIDETHTYNANTKAFTFSIASTAAMFGTFVMSGTVGGSALLASSALAVGVATPLVAPALILGFAALAGASFVGSFVMTAYAKHKNEVAKDEIKQAVLSVNGITDPAEVKEYMAKDKYLSNTSAIREAEILFKNSLYDDKVIEMVQKIKEESTITNKVKNSISSLRNKFLGNTTEKKYTI